MTRPRVIALLAVLWTALLLSAPATAQIQLQPGYQPAPLGKDTLCFLYRFETGDTLIYDIDARDSIWVQGEGRVLKLRRSRVMIVCDSAFHGTYWLRQIMTSSVERQSTVDTASERATHPWVDRVLTFVMDSLGKRSFAAVTQPDVVAMHPGGPFSPMLLPPLGESCGRQNQSWIVEDTLELTENGVPPPVIANTTLWRVLDKVDTLGRRFRQIQYSTTARGSHKVSGDGMAMTTTAIINSYGKLSFDDLLNLPYHVFATAENKLNIALKSGIERDAMQKTSVDAQLLEMRSHNPARGFMLARRLH